MIQLHNSVVHHLVLSLYKNLHFLRFCSSCWKVYIVKVRCICCSLAQRKVFSERERLQCFSQPASLITYRRRQRSNVEDIKTVQNELENLHMILLSRKNLMVFVSVETKGAYRCLTAWKAGHSKIMCNASATATLPEREREITML